MSCRDDDDDNVEGSFQTLLRRRKEEWAVGDNIQRSSNRVKGKPIRVIKRDETRVSKFVLQSG
jgi:hypothetical protein